MRVMILLFLLIPYHSFSQESKETTNVYSEIIISINKHYPEHCIISKSTLPHQLNSQIKTITAYKKWINNRPKESVLTQNIRNVFNEQELSDLMKIYEHQSFELIEWSDDISFLVDNFNNCSYKQTIELAVPILNHSMNKALVLLRLNNQSGSSSQINVLVKENNKWLLKGVVPLVLGDKLNNR